MTVVWGSWQPPEAAACSNTWPSPCKASASSRPAGGPLFLGLSLTLRCALKSAPGHSWVTHSQLMSNFSYICEIPLPCEVTAMGAASHHIQGFCPHSGRGHAGVHVGGGHLGVHLRILPQRAHLDCTPSTLSFMLLPVMLSVSYICHINSNK